MNWNLIQMLCLMSCMHVMAVSSRSNPFHTKPTFLPATPNKASVPRTVVKTKFHHSKHQNNSESSFDTLATYGVFDLRSRTQSTIQPHRLSMSSQNIKVPIMPQLPHSARTAPSYMHDTLSSSITNRFTDSQTASNVAINHKMKRRSSIDARQSTTNTDFVPINSRNKKVTLDPKSSAKKRFETEVAELLSQIEGRELDVAHKPQNQKRKSITKTHANKSRITGQSTLMIDTELDESVLQKVDIHGKAKKNGQTFLPILRHQKHCKTVGTRDCSHKENEDLDTLLDITSKTRKESGRSLNFMAERRHQSLQSQRTNSQMSTVSSDSDYDTKRPPPSSLLLDLLEDTGMHQDMMDRMPEMHSSDDELERHEDF